MPLPAVEFHFLVVGPRELQYAEYAGGAHGI